MPKLNEPIPRKCQNVKCGKEFLDDWGTRRYCDELCKRRQKWRERKRRSDSRGGYNRRTYIQLWLDALGIEDQRVPCSYCETLVDLDSFVIDHVIPKSQLKTRAECQDIKNLTISCKSCNHRKASMPEEIFRHWIEYEKGQRDAKI